MGPNAVLDHLESLIAGSPLTQDESRELATGVLELYDLVREQDRMLDAIMDAMTLTIRDRSACLTRPNATPDKNLTPSATLAPSEVYTWWGKLAAGKDPEERTNLSPVEASATALIARQSHDRVATDALGRLVGDDARLRDEMRQRGERDTAILVAIRQRQYSGRQQLAALASGEAHRLDRGWLVGATEAE